MPFTSGMKSGFHNDHFNAAGPGYVDGDNAVIIIFFLRRVIVY
jgi:hypothetical protein